MKKPKYKLLARCSKLRWDQYRNYWFCCQTAMCYKHSDKCPLIEATAREVQKGSIQPSNIQPASIRDGVKQWISDRNSNRQLSLNF